MPTAQAILHLCELTLAVRVVLSVGRTDDPRAGGNLRGLESVLVRPATTGRWYWSGRSADGQGAYALHTNMHLQVVVSNLTSVPV